MSEPISRDAAEWLDYFVTFGAQIYVREQVGGKWGAYSLAELPGALAFQHARRLMDRGTIVRVRESGDSISEAMKAGDPLLGDLRDARKAQPPVLNKSGGSDVEGK